MNRVGAFCALCTSPITGEVRKAPLGKNDALVSVCDSCFDEPAEEYREHQVGYEVRDGNKGSFRQQVAAAVVKLADEGIGPGMTRDDQRRMANAPMRSGRERGHDIFRVPRLTDEGRPRDGETAYALATKKYGNGLAMVAVTTRYFVYQRLAPAKRHERDPLAAIAAYQTSSGPRQQLNKWKTRPA